MQELMIGDFAPDFTLPATGAAPDITLSSLKGRMVVLYFYPKDATSGCTREACDFRDNMGRLAGVDGIVLGVSKDSIASHERFGLAQGLKFPLLSDPDGAVCEAYGVWVEKRLYGRSYMGIDRATFLIDANGRIAAIWRKVKVPGHVDAVLEAVQALSKKAA